MASLWVLPMIIVALVSLGVYQNIHAQTSENSGVINGPQVTLSENLSNNPVAQDILRKIEQTKQWIEDLEKRNYKQLEKQKELEEKRQQALEKLNQDLADWERLWEYYSPKNSFDRFVDKVSNPQIKEVFWDQFEFKEQKVKAGREAMKKVFANGGSLQEARQAYHTAAETKRIELIEANAQFNVRRQLAYYGEQILFDRDGQFINSTITGEKLRKFYEDFRSNPAYLEANPNDKASWYEFGKTHSETECRPGYVVIYRFHANDYVCVTMETAEMWIRHGMAEIQGKSSESSESSTDENVNPLTRCDEGFTVILNKDPETYSCVLNETAQEWVNQKIAEYPDPEEFIMKSIERKESSLQIEAINQNIREMAIDLENEKSLLDKEYDRKIDELFVNSKNDERQARSDYNQREGMSKDELSQTIIHLREKYDSDRQQLLEDKERDIDSLERHFENRIVKLIDQYADDPMIKIIHTSSQIGYEAILRE